MVTKKKKKTELKNSFPVTFSALGVNLQTEIHFFSTQILNS